MMIVESIHGSDQGHNIDAAELNGYEAKGYKLNVYPRRRGGRVEFSAKEAVAIVRKGGSIEVVDTFGRTIGFVVDVY